MKRFAPGASAPGLLRQHLTAVEAAQRIGAAEVRGAEIDSQELTFVPQTVMPGDYQFSIGTAGSTTLVLQTILPVLMRPWLLPIIKAILVARKLKRRLLRG